MTPPAKSPGFPGQRGRSVGVKISQGSEDALKEQGQLGADGPAALRGVPHVWHPHGGQLRGDPVGDLLQTADPSVLARHIILVGGGLVRP